MAACVCLASLTRLRGGWNKADRRIRMVLYDYMAARFCDVYVYNRTSESDWLSKFIYSCAILQQIDIW
jgi:hypothetical protein